MDALSKLVEKSGDLMILWVKMVFDVESVNAKEIEDAYSGNLLIQAVAGLVLIGAAFAQEPGAETSLVSASHLIVVLVLLGLLYFFIKASKACGKRRASANVSTDLVIKCAFVAFTPGLAIIGGAMTMMLRLTAVKGATTETDVTVFLILMFVGLACTAALPASVIQKVTNCCERRTVTAFSFAVVLLGALLFSYDVFMKPVDNSRQANALKQYSEDAPVRTAER